jgi:hypothetical protein
MSSHYLKIFEGEKLTYAQLIQLIEIYMQQFLFLQYANGYMSQVFYAKRLGVVIVLAGNDESIPSLGIKQDMILTALQAFQKNKGYSEQEGAKLFGEDNMHFIRTKSLNNLYELLFDYSRMQDNKMKLWKYLETLSWFRVLHILRNIGSHFNLHGKMPGWVDGYPAILKWKTITIDKNQHANTVRYSDFEVFDLMVEALKFVRENPTLF